MTTTEKKAQPTLSRARETALRLSQMLHGFLGGHLPEAKLAKELRELAQWLAPEAPQIQQPAEAATGIEVEIFDHWRRALGKPIAKLTAERRSKIRARLKEGYTAAQIKTAITNAANSPFHRGENESGTEYVCLTLILRNGAKLEYFMGLGGGGEPEPIAERGAMATPQDRDEALLARLQRDAAGQLATGDNDAYNKTQTAIRAVRQRLGADGGRIVVPGPTEKRLGYRGQPARLPSRSVPGET